MNLFDSFHNCIQRTRRMRDIDRQISHVDANAIDRILNSVGTLSSFRNVQERNGYKVRTAEVIRCDIQSPFRRRRSVFVSRDSVGWIRPTHSITECVIILYHQMCSGISWYGCDLSSLVFRSDFRMEPGCQRTGTIMEANQVGDRGSRCEGSSCYGIDCISAVLECPSKDGISVCEGGDGCLSCCNLLFRNVRSRWHICVSFHRSSLYLAAFPRCGIAFFS